MRAVLVDKDELRYTPAGIAVFEAGAERLVQFTLTVLAFADTALRLNRVPLGSELRLEGFLATRSLRSSRLTVHVTEFKIN